MSGPTLSIAYEGVTYSVAFDRWDAYQSDRARYRWEIRHGDLVDTNDDLTVVGDIHLPKALEALLSFLEAFLESRAHQRRTGQAGENGDLFADWLADLDADHVSSLRMELDPEEAFA